MRSYKAFRYWRARRCKAGQNNPVAKITKSVVDYIRMEYVPYKTTAPLLAAKFGLSVQHVRAILRGQYWPGEYGNVGKRKLTAEQEAAIIQLRYEEKWSERKLAEGFGISRGLVQYVIRGKTPYIKSVGFLCK